MAGTVRRRGSSWQAILSFRDPLNPANVVQYTATRPSKREAEKALAQLVLNRDRGRMARGNQTFGAAVVYRDYRARLAAEFGVALGDDSYLFSFDPTARTWGHPGTMTDKFCDAKGRVGLPRLRMHDLRHQAATVLLNRRISPRVVAEPQQPTKSRGQSRRRRLANGGR